MTSIPMGERSPAATFEPYLSQGVNSQLAAYADACRKVALADDVPLCDLYGEWAGFVKEGARTAELIWLAEVPPICP